jgi:hypothetical protein
MTVRNSSGISMPTETGRCQQPAARRFFGEEFALGGGMAMAFIRLMRHADCYR